MHILLRLRIAFDPDVAFPEIVPGFLMKLQQPLAAFELCKNGGAFGFVQRVVVMRRGDGTAGNGKRLRLSGFQTF